MHLTALRMARKSDISMIASLLLPMMKERIERLALVDLIILMLQQKVNGLYVVVRRVFRAKHLCIAVLAHYKSLSKNIGHFFTSGTRNM